MKKKKSTSADYTAAEWQAFLDTLRVGGEVPADMWEAYQDEINAEAADKLPVGQQEVPF